MSSVAASASVVVSGSANYKASQLSLTQLADSFGSACCRFPGHSPGGSDLSKDGSPLRFLCSVPAVNRLPAAVASATCWPFESVRIH